MKQLLILLPTLLLLAGSSCYKQRYYALKRVHDSTVVVNKQIDSLNTALHHTQDSLHTVDDILKKDFALLLGSFDSVKTAFAEYKKRIEVINSGYIEFQTPRHCNYGGQDRHDDKDGDTKLYIEVTGAYGTVDAVAWAKYDLDEKFDDNDEIHSVPLTIGNPKHPEITLWPRASFQCCWMLKLTTYPKGWLTDEGNDTWVFKARAVFKTDWEKLLLPNGLPVFIQLKEVLFR